MPLGLSQEHAKSGLDRANSSHGRKRMTRFQMEAIVVQVPLSFSTPRRATASSCKTRAARMCSSTSPPSSAPACAALTRGRSSPLISKPTAAAASPRQPICKGSNRSLYQPPLSRIWGDDGKWLRVTLESPIKSDRVRRASAEYKMGHQFLNAHLRPSMPSAA